MFDRVGFSYKEGEPVLREVSFTARQGQVTALVGPSGGGKSTSAKLAARFWDIDKGTITIGGCDISKIEPETLLKSFAIVFQDVVLFNNTIMENIRYGKPDATDEEVVMAARNANAHEFIMSFPEGYDTDIGQRGVKHLLAVFPRAIRHGSGKMAPPFQEANGSGCPSQGLF